METNKICIELSLANCLDYFRTFTFIRSVLKTRGMEPNEDNYTEVLAPIRELTGTIDNYQNLEKQYRTGSGIYPYG